MELFHKHRKEENALESNESVKKSSKENVQIELAPT